MAGPVNYVLYLPRTAATHCLDTVHIILHIKRTTVCSQVVGGNGTESAQIKLY